jgi:hypothetical protein
MSKLLPAAAATTLLFLSSQAFAETRSLDVAEFSAVEVTSGITADITVGGAQSVSAEARNPKAFDDFRYEVRGGVLRVWYDWNIFRIFDFSDHEMRVTVSVPAMNALTVTSGSSADARGVVADEFKAEITSGASARIDNAKAATYSIAVTSGAHLDINGVCTTAKVEATTGSNLGAKDLLCSDVWASATTGASLTITANGTISGETTTGASLTVYGSPEVKDLETSTGGSVTFPK